eukprot:SAG25_NODE_399_length_8483_cov_375.064647_9_plen_70_part_00
MPQPAGSRVGSSGPQYCMAVGPFLDGYCANDGRAAAARPRKGKVVVDFCPIMYASVYSYRFAYLATAVL